MIVRPIVEAADLRAARQVIDSADLALGPLTATLTGFARAERVGRLVKLTGTISNSGAPGTGAVLFTVPVGFRPRTNAMRFGSQAVRDMVIATGMEHGANESYNNLADLVRTP